MRRAAIATALMLVEGGAVLSRGAPARADAFAPAQAPVALSSLAVMAAPPAIASGAEAAGVTVNETAGKVTWYSLPTAKQRGFCVEPSFLPPRLTDATTWTRDAEDAPPSFLVHLVQKDGKATYEKQRLTFDARSRKIEVGPRVSVDLREVASVSGVTVWAYREGRHVILLSRAFEGGFDTPHRAADDPGTASMIGTDGCPYGVARLDAGAAKAGAAAELAGDLPKRGKGKDAVTPRFFVFASLARLSRDPEPMLTVRVRVSE